MAKALSLKQEKVLHTVQSYWQEHHTAPSIMDLAKRLGIGKATAYEHLLALKNKGYLQHQAKAARTWRAATKALPNTRHIPLLGRVAAGLPILAQEHIDDWLPVSYHNIHDSLFALRVRGNSMIDGNILDGDIVISRQQKMADNGDIIVALVDGETTTCKQFERQHNRVRLLPMNKDYEALEFRDNRIEILGKVIEIRRQI